MKLSPCLIISTLGVSLAMNVLAGDAVIALSPHQDANQAKQQVIIALKFASQLKPGDKTVFVDAYNQRIISEFIVPEDPRYKGPKAILAVNRTGVSTLINFAKNATPPSVNGPSHAGSIRLPQTLRFIAQHITKGAEQDVVIMGSPFYHDQRDLRYSMANARVPSDGHINNSTAITPFGTAGYPDLLSGIRVHMGYGNDSILQSEEHEHFAQRFFTLYIESMGGQLVYFNPGEIALFDGISSQAHAPKHEFVREETTKLEMHQYLPPMAQEPTPIYDRQVSTAPVTARQIRGAENVEVGISWDCNSCDMDLYARPVPGAAVLYYGQTQTAEGRYWKDFRRSPRPTNGHEIIAFNHPVDLKQTLLVVNFYHGHAPDGVNVEVRIAFDGKTYATNLHIAANDGDKASGIDKIIENERSSQSTTTVINPLLVLGLAG